MKIAVCFSGQPRYIEEGYYFVKKYLLDKYDVDVFVHTWWDDSYPGSEFDYTDLNRDCKYSEDTLLKISKLYNPKLIQTEKQIAFEYFDDVHYGRLHPVSPYSMFYSIKKSNDLKKQYELENNFIYPLVIRCRFDIVLSRFNLDLNTIDRKKIYVGGEHHYLGGQPTVPNDQFAISSSYNMDYYSSLFDNIPLYWKEGHRVFIGERLLQYHLNKGEMEIHFTTVNELLTNGWWQYSTNDSNFWQKYNCGDDQSGVRQFLLEKGFSFVANVCGDHIYINTK